MDVNYIFGVSKYLTQHTDTVKQGYMVDAQGLQIKTGAPCLVFSNSKDKDPTSNRLGSGIPPRKFIVAPFPTGYRFHPRCLLDTHNQTVAVKELEETDFLDRIKVIETSSVNPNKLIHAIDYVKDKGPLTFLIDEKKQLQDKLTKVVSKLSKIFKHRSLFFHESPGPSQLREGEKVLFALSLMDVRHCLPIFDPAKVDGVMLHGAVIYPVRSSRDDRLYRSAEFFMLFSQFKENLGAIDGDNVGKCQFGTLSDMVSIIKNFGKYYADVGKSKAVNEAKTKKKKGMGSGFSDTLLHSGPSGITCSSNTSTTAYSNYGSTIANWST